MIRAKLLRELNRNASGSVLIEFALLAPLFLTLLIGVFQVGVYLQNYNAVRSVVSDAARYVTVEYQKGNSLTNTEIRSVILSRAVNVPYMLDINRLEVDVDTVLASRVVGATELEIDVDYRLTDFLPFVELPGTTLTYSRPVFVVAPAAPAS